MDNIHIPTTQNVDIEFEPANIGERLLAIMIDFSIGAAYYFVMMIIVASINPYGGFEILLLLLMLPVIFYHFFMEVFANGQSVGKKAMKLRVVKKDGSKPGISSFLLRWVFRIFENVFVVMGAIPLVSILMTPSAQRLGDLAAGTVVIRLKGKVKLRDTIFVQTEENYEPVFHTAKNLSDKEIALIRAVLKELKETKFSQESVDIANRLKEAILKKLNYMSDLPVEMFFNTLLKDYNWLNSQE